MGFLEEETNHEVFSLNSGRNILPFFFSLLSYLYFKMSQLVIKKILTRVLVNPKGQNNN